VLQYAETDSMRFSLFINVLYSSTAHATSGKSRDRLKAELRTGHDPGFELINSQSSWLGSVVSLGSASWRGHPTNMFESSTNAQRAWPIGPKVVISLGGTFVAHSGNATQLSALKLRVFGPSIQVMRSLRHSKCDFVSVRTLLEWTCA
jgi:hypothetical protein